VDVDRMVLSGFSAGGHLASLYSSLCEERHSCPAGQVLHFPFLEKGAKIFCSEVGAAFNALEDYDACFPTALADGATVPTILYHASGDPVVPTVQMTDFVTALAGQNAEYEYYEVEDGGHYLVPFSQVASVSGGKLESSGNYASLIERALTLPAPACVRCDNVPTAWMLDNAQTCDEAKWHITNKCSEDPWWETMGYCRASCYDAGRGYLGEVCCPPRLTSNCIECSDDLTPWMATNGKTCGDMPDTIAAKCTRDDWWISNNFCQQTCFDADRGYEGITCCAGE